MWGNTGHGGPESSRSRSYEPLQGGDADIYATAYYDRQYATAAGQGAGTEVSRNAGGSPSAGAKHEDGRRGARRSRKCSRELATKVVLGLGLVIALGVAIYASVCAIQTTLSSGFAVFSAIAWQLWYPSFWAIMIIIVILSVTTIATTLVGLWATYRESKPLLRVLIISSVTIGLLFLGLTLFSWLYTSWGGPPVIRAANLICQDPTVWGCPATGRSLGGDPLEGDPVGGEGGETSTEGAEGARPGRLQPRRLTTSSTAVAYVASLAQGISQESSAARCRQISALCVPPPNFDPLTACVCSGVWDFSESESKTSTVQPGQQNPWFGSQGAFCGNWGRPAGTWCFVSFLQQCRTESKAGYTSSSGRSLTLSSGPCSDAVESRSQLVLDGIAATKWPLAVAGGLGALLLLAAGCAGMLLAGTKPAKVEATPGAGRPPSHGQRQHGEEEEEEEREAERPLAIRFEEAQREAVRKLRDSTPEELKLQLYGFYKQAMQGDNNAERPSFFNRRERAKHDAWASHRGLSRERAIEGYIQTVALIE